MAEVAHLQFSTFNLQDEEKRFSDEVFPREFAARSGEGVAPMD